MTDELKNDPEQGVSQNAAGEAAAEAPGDKVKRHLAGSIYLWACWENSTQDSAKLVLTDVLIGWLVPLLQGLAYIMLIARVDNFTDSADGDSSGTNYSLASITGAMYLLVASTTPDLRAGFSLLVDGLHPYHHVFGLVLLTLYALMITAAMKVLFADAEDDASVVINAVTVLFIADVDEKALSFFSTVPQKWRLFWATYTVGISFVLALVGLIYVGNPSVTSDFVGNPPETSKYAGNPSVTSDYVGNFNVASDYDGNFNVTSDAGSTDDFRVFDFVPGWFICMVNPGAVTVSSFYLSAAVKAFAEACTVIDVNSGVSVWRVMPAMVIVRSYKGVAKAKDFLRENPIFCVVVVLWLAHGLVSWWFLVQAFGRPLLRCWDVNANISRLTSGSFTVRDSAHSYELNVALTVANIALGIGFVMKMVGVCVRAKRRPRPHDEPRHLSDVQDAAPQQSCGRFECTFLPSLLFGWGVGYLITSVLMGSSIYSGGWDERPVYLEIISYITMPWFFLAVIFLMADNNFLGKKFIPLMDYTARTLGDKNGIWFWILATVIRDILFIWVFMWYVLVPCLNNI